MITEENIEVRYPLVSDSMLLQLANDIAVAEDVSRRQRTVIGRLVDGITGHGQRATALSVGALAGGERTLMAWVTEVCQSGRVTNLTLARRTDRGPARYHRTGQPADQGFRGGTDQGR
jgi:hypothetical protein